MLLFDLIMLELYKFNVTPGLIDIYLKLIPEAFLGKLHIPLFLQQFYVSVDEEELTNNSQEAQNNGESNNGEFNGDQDISAKVLEDNNTISFESNSISKNQSSFENSKELHKQVPINQFQIKSSQLKKKIYYRLFRFVLGFIYQYTIFDDSLKKKNRQSYYMNDFFDSPEDEFLDEMDFYEILRDERVQNEKKKANKNKKMNESCDQAYFMDLNTENRTALQNSALDTNSYINNEKEDDPCITYLRVKTSNDQIMELQKESFEKFRNIDNNVIYTSFKKNQILRTMKIRKLLNIFNSIRGVIKFYFNFSSEEGFHYIIMNYLDMILLKKKYKVAISSRLKSGGIFFKVLLRRSIKLFGRHFYYSISGWNIWQFAIRLFSELYILLKFLSTKYFFNNSINYTTKNIDNHKFRINWKESFKIKHLSSISSWIYNLFTNVNIAHSLSYNNFRLRMKLFSDGLKKLSLTKQGWQKTPISSEYIISKWKFYNEQFEKEFSTEYERELYSYNDNWIELWKWLQLLFYSIRQFGRVIQYLIKFKINNFKQEFILSLGKIKSFLLMQYFAQLFALSSGYYYKMSTELSWKTLPDSSTVYGAKIPLEWHWGCDLFRIWISVGCISEYWKSRKKDTVVDFISETSRPFYYPMVLPSQETAISALSATFIPDLDTIDNFSIPFENQKIIYNEHNEENCLSLLPIDPNQNLIDSNSELIQIDKQNLISKSHITKEAINIKSKNPYFSDGERNSNWKHSQHISIAITMFDLFTILSYTFSIQSMIYQGKKVYKKLYKLYQNLLDLIYDFISKNPRESYF